jgi:secreted PhoX family phosphatase
MRLNRRKLLAAGAGLLTLPRHLLANDPDVPAMLRPAPTEGFDVRVLTTTGDTINGYRPPGILDGTAAWQWDPDTVRLFVNHEFSSSLSYPWQLENGVTLRGARISFFDVDRQTREVRDAGVAIRKIRDRRGENVMHPRQVNERWDDDVPRGLHTLCSAQGIRAGEFGFVDDLMFTNEEVSAREDHPHGGSVWALAVRDGTLWALPELGRGAWENVAAVATSDQDRPDGRIALLLGDDLEFGRAPLYLWVGRKQSGGNLVERNGLANGQLYVWVADAGWRSPADWRGTGNVAEGEFVPLAARDISKPGKRGYDRDGYLDDLTLRESAFKKGAFMFSRPEDLHTNPQNPSEVVFCSCGHGRLFPDDEWGTIYLLNVDIPDDPAAMPAARITILHDSDDIPGRGIRSADNVVWASDGQIYVQEDDATKTADFMVPTGREASIWRINPNDPDDRGVIATIDRSVILPADARDVRADNPGMWESSGILDVSREFGARDELLLLATVQAHTIRDGSLGKALDLFQGGQLVLLSRKRSG